MEKYRHGEEVQGSVEKYRARWRSTGHGGEVWARRGSSGHGEEVQGTVRKYRGPCRSTGRGEEVQDVVRKYRAS